jgi:hypothetical protein
MAEGFDLTFAFGSACHLGTAANTMSRAALGIKFFAAYLFLPAVGCAVFTGFADLAPADKHYARGSAGSVSEAANRDGHRKFPRHSDPAVWNCWADSFGSDF